MSETPGRINTPLDEAGQIIRPTTKSRWSFLEKPLRKVRGWTNMGRWAANEIRSGGYREPKPGEAAAKIEALKARLDASQPVKVDSQGQVVPQPVTPTAK